MTQNRTILREEFIHRDRRLLLEVLNTRFPLTIGEDELLGGLEKVVAPEYAKRDIETLRQLGLITRTWEKATPISAIEEWRIALTAKGELFCRRGFPWDKVESL